MNLNNSISIDNNIDNYKKHIDLFRSEANTQGIWLFTSTIGCWSIDIHYIKIIASILILFIFGFLINQKVSDKRSFINIENDIEDDINRNLIGDEKLARLYKLNLVKDYRKSIKPVLKASPIFIICYIFYSISLINFSISCYNLTIN